MSAALVVVLASFNAHAEPPSGRGDVRSLEGLEETQIEGRVRTEVPGTVTAVDATGVVTVHAAGADLPLEIPPASAAGLRPGTAVTVEVVLVARPPAPGTPGGGPAPPPAMAPGREVHTPSEGGAHRVHPDAVRPSPER